MRTINVGGNQGRGNPPAVQMDEPEGPGMAVSRWVYALGAVCIAAWICAISAGAYWLVP